MTCEDGSYPYTTCTCQKSTGIHSARVPALEDGSKNAASMVWRYSAPTPSPAGFSLVLNGLDNLEARRHVNRLAMAAGVPLVESGTAGYLGQVGAGEEERPSLYADDDTKLPAYYLAAQMPL
jgi:hypothetical protein